MQKDYDDNQKIIHTKECGCKYYKKNIQSYYFILLEEPETEVYINICYKHLNEFVLKEYNQHQWHLTASKTFDKYDDNMQPIDK